MSNGMKYPTKAVTMEKMKVNCILITMPKIHPNKCQKPYNNSEITCRREADQPLHRMTFRYFLKSNLADNIMSYLTLVSRYISVFFQLRYTQVFKENQSACIPMQYRLQFQFHFGNNLWTKSHAKSASESKIKIKSTAWNASQIKPKSRQQEKQQRKNIFNIQASGKYRRKYGYDYFQYDW